MIPTLEKNHPQTVGADSIATYGLGSESTCVHWPDCPRRGLVQAPEIPPSLRWDSRPGCLLVPPPLRHDRSPIPESWTFSHAADRCGQFQQWTQRQQVGLSSRIALRLLPNDSLTLRSRPSALSNQAQRSGRKSPRAVNRSEAVALAAIPLPSVGFPTFGSRFWSRIIFAAAPVIAASSHCVDDDFLILTRIRSGVNTGYTRCVERASIIEAGRHLIDNVLDFHEDFIANGNSLRSFRRRECRE